ncbi:MAG: hypothetical protein HWN66_19375 [Candidatus Helarchaeota archaeon]|nr:hypothetical protein [Candidatus Helarchaeota archaeon]
MTLDTVGLGNTYLYVGSFLAPQAGQTVNYSITVFDNYGRFNISTSFVFTVITPEEEFPTAIIAIIGVVAVGAIGAAVVVTRMRTKAKKKEYIAEELLPLPI